MAACCVLLSLGGCERVLGLKDPTLIVTVPSGARGDADGGVAGGGVVDGVGPDDQPCEDDEYRCEDANQGRSICRDGKWVKSPCEAGTQCNSEDPETCTARARDGERCTKPDTYSCGSAASAARSRCDGESMTFVDASCDEGEACDRSDGRCRPIVPACEGRKPGEAVCDGATRIVCGQDLTTSKEEECKTAAHCTQAKAAACAACVEGEHTCDPAGVLSVCNEARDGFTMKATCQSAALCSEVAGECTDAACRPGQATCDGDELQHCNADQSGFGMPEQCGPGLCNAMRGTCDACGEDACRDDHTRAVCSDDRQNSDEEACPRDRPLCVGSGVCVECRSASDCAAAAECDAVACSSNRCEVTHRPAGTACNRDSGECDGHGSCVRVESPNPYFFDPGQGYPGFHVDAVIHGEHLSGVTAVRFLDVSGLTATIERGGTSTELPVEIAIGAGVLPGRYAIELTTRAGTTPGGDSARFEVLTQPLARLEPDRGPPGTVVQIHGKFDPATMLPTPIRDPAIPAGMPALFTTVLIREDGVEVPLAPIAAENDADGGQVVTVTIPERQGSWARTEIVTIVLDYSLLGTHGELEFTYQP